MEKFRNEWRAARESDTLPADENLDHDEEKDENGNDRDVDDDIFVVVPEADSSSRRSALQPPAGATEGGSPSKDFCLIPTAVNSSGRMQTMKPITHFLCQSSRLLKLKAELMAIVYTVDEELLQWGTNSIVDVVNSSDETDPSLHLERNRKETFQHFQHCVQVAISPKELLDAMFSFERALPSDALGESFLRAETRHASAPTCAALARRLYTLDRAIMYEASLGCDRVMKGKSWPHSVLLPPPPPRCCVSTECPLSLGHLPPCALPPADHVKPSGTVLGAASGVNPGGTNPARVVADGLFFGGHAVEKLSIATGEVLMRYVLALSTTFLLHMVLGIYSSYAELWVWYS